MTTDTAFGLDDIRNCAVLERTADGVPVGRCWYALKNGVCPRHGDVSKQMAEYAKTGKLFEDPRMKP